MKLGRIHDTINVSGSLVEVATKVAAIQSALDATQVAAGLNADGTLTAFSGT